MKKADATPEAWAKYLDACRTRLKKWRSENRVQFNAARREHRKKHLKQRRKIEREYSARSKHVRAASHRRRRTFFTEELYQAVVQLQDDLCAICRRPFDLGRRCADHDHNTKTPRGLLCIHCNAAEGHIKKVGLTPDEFGRRAREYLDSPPASKVKICH